MLDAAKVSAESTNGALVLEVVVVLDILCLVFLMMVVGDVDCLDVLLRGDFLWTTTGGSKMGSWLLFFCKVWVVHGDAGCLFCVL